MAATNIFYRIPSQRGTRIATLSGSECTLNQFCDHIIDSEGFNRNDFIIASGTKLFRPSSCNLQSINLRNNTHVDIIIPLLGGKGGFGSLLRAIGAQIEKTTNRDACRDLSGRRLRDVKREDELRKLLALQEKLEEEKKRRRREKLEKLKKKSEASSTSAPIQELVSMFEDTGYNKRRLELSDIIEAAVEKGIINSKKRHLDEIEASERKKTKPEESVIKAVPLQSVEQEDGDTCSAKVPKSELNSIKTHNNITCKSTRETTSKTLKNDLWLGLDDEDGEDDDDEEAVRQTNSV